MRQDSEARRRRRDVAFFYTRCISGYMQVSTTAGTREAATELAGSAVMAGLAAGAQVYGPVTSVFWHLGE